MASPPGKALSVPASRIWTVCMLAHVDHGKSALSDALISANGIISARSAGKVRYMDSREDEQRRGITMKSSSIALAHRPDPAGPLSVVNLVDSPGHCDFSGEVEAALRVCDGAVLVVDVVEGVCVQTVTVLRAALERGVRPVLVLNKIDRLFVELQLDPTEAYHHIQRVLEQVNVIMGLRQVEDMIARADLDHGAGSGAAAASDSGCDSSEWTLPDEASANDDEDDSISGFFSPERGNVAFASAVDGWAFRLDEFAALFSQKFGISESVLKKTLWGNYYLQPKAKRIIRKRASDTSTSSAKPMFVQFIMASLHSVYESVYSTQHDMTLAIERREKIASKLSLKISNRDLRHKDASVALHAIMNAWLPAAHALLNLITARLPSTAVAQRTPARLAVLWPHLDRLIAGADSSSVPVAEQRAAVENTDPDGPLLAYVTKMLEPVNAASSTGGKMNIRLPKLREAMAAIADAAAAGESSADLLVSEEIENPVKEDENEGSLVAFARLVSGTVSVGDSVYVYSPHYAVGLDGSFDESTVGSAKVTALFLLMGRDMENVSQATAGSVVGIAGLSNVILKTATVSSLPPGKCLPLGGRGRLTGLGGSGGNDAAVRVAVEPHLPGDVPMLQAGLRKLNQADPAVDTYVTSKGEHVIAASGELHLERCLLDLRERFAKGIKIHVSSPIISFRETVAGGVPVATVAELQDGFRATGSVPSHVVVDSPPGDSDGVAEGDADRGLRPSTSSDPTAGWRVRICQDKGGGTGTNTSSSLSSSLFVKHGRFIEVGNTLVSFRICAAPIPVKLAAALDEAGIQVRTSTSSTADTINMSLIDELRCSLKKAARDDAADGAVRTGLQKQFIQFWTEDVLSHIWSSGPRRFGSNLLVGPRPSDSLAHWMAQLIAPSDGCESKSSSSLTTARPSLRAERELEKAIASGFQLGAQAGPLCEEPLHGVAIFIDNITCQQDVASVEDAEASDFAVLHSSITGLAIGSTKEAVRAAVLNTSPRIMEAALKVEVSVAGDALGGTYTVLGKRRGRVLSEDMKDGVNVFSVEAILPQTESFGFSDALRKQTSGFASAQMMFSHWETVDVDPFWTPRTEEELEDLGLEDNTEANNNLARRLVNGVRKRKGLKLEEKIVENAEKQRTLTRNK
jgi:ribosome assembly protein 1